MDRYELAVIGAGWAGFNAAIKAAQLGLKVALIEKNLLGGTCLNLGCIPTKSLIQSAKIYSLLKKSMRFGVDIDSPKINFEEIQERKNRIIEGLRSGMQFGLKTKNIHYINATAKLISNEELLVGGDAIKAKYILIATGSYPMELATLKFDGRKILSSNEILNLKTQPQSLLVIGGGVIGCEFASLFNILGTRVSIVELMPQLLPQEDKEIAKKLETIFKKRGIEVHTNTDVKTINLNDYETILVSIGRVPNSKDLGFDKIGVKLEKDKIIVDDYLRTNISNIYAAGDCTGNTMLAHFASYQGSQAAENIACPENLKNIFTPAIPNCIFTYPDIARVGLTEDETKAKGKEVKIDRFDFLGSGMARILDETEGFIKIITDKNSQEILGASIIGPGAVELIGILTLAIQSRLSASELRRTVFAHPTLSECISETLKDK